MAAVSTPKMEAPSRAPAPGMPSLEQLTGRSEPRPEGEEVLLVKGLRTFFFTYDGVVRAIDGVSFKISRGETLGLVGETGCGKSVTAFSITRLIPDPPGRIIEGEIWFRGANLLWGLDKEAKYNFNAKTQRMKVKRWFRRVKAANDRMTAVRGSGIGMIFQEPSQAMNPIFSVSDQVGEALMIHRGRLIIDQMLKAKPSAPGTKAAIEALANAAAEGSPTEIRAAAVALGEVVQAPSLATQAYYYARTAGPRSAELKSQVARALSRFRLSSAQRSYLGYRSRLLALDRQLHLVYIDEMRAGQSRPGPRARIQAQKRRQSISHFYFDIWGVRGRMQRLLKEELFWRVVGALEGVSIANPVLVARGYPHELSGGMLQRVMISMALAPDPDLLIADEPTTALDVTVQAQILELMRDLKHRIGSAILLITHDLAVIAEVADRVCVMYAGQIVESGPVREIYQRPLHPYAQGLLASIPRIDQPERELSSIPGSVPNLINPPSGCRFHPRCPYAMPVCKQGRPPMTVEGPGHVVACYLYKGPVAPD